MSWRDLYPVHPMRATILKYLPEDAPERYRQSLTARREVLRLEILRRVREMADEGQA
jgi:hypothetical protein